MRRSTLMGMWLLAAGCADGSHAPEALDPGELQQAACEDIPGTWRLEMTPVTQEGNGCGFRGSRTWVTTDFVAPAAGQPKQSCQTGWTPGPAQSFDIACSGTWTHECTGSFGRWYTDLEIQTRAPGQLTGVYTSEARDPAGVVLCRTDYTFVGAPL